MDTRLAEQYMKYPRLEKNDAFTFGCSGCGKCCREREDIILSPLDIFKMAKHLDMSNEDFIKTYCEWYEGSMSKIPVVRLKPREYRKTCPLNDKGRCRVHVQKPAVCALFPLGRMTKENTEEQTKEFFYFIQPIKCGNKRQTQTVQQWLEEFNMQDEEHVIIMWHDYIGKINGCFRLKPHKL